MFGVDDVVIAGAGFYVVTRIARRMNRRHSSTYNGGSGSSSESSLPTYSPQPQHYWQEAWARDQQWKHRNDHVIAAAYGGRPPEDRRLW